MGGRRNTLDSYQLIRGGGGEGGERDLRNVVSGRDGEVSWKKLQQMLEKVTKLKEQVLKRKEDPH